MPGARPFKLYMERTVMLFEKAKDTEEFRKWKKRNGYLVCYYSNGGTFFTVLTKKTFENVVKEKFWRGHFSVSRDSFYVRVLSMELTYTWPVWFRKLLKGKKLW